MCSLSFVCCFFSCDVNISGYHVINNEPFHFFCFLLRVCVYMKESVEQKKFIKYILESPDKTFLQSSSEQIIFIL